MGFIRKQLLAFEYLFCFFLSKIISKKSAFIVSSLISKGSYSVKKNEYKNVCRNMAQVKNTTFLNKENKAHAKSIYIHFGKMCVRFLYDSNGKKLNEKVDVEGLEYLDDALSQKKGCILASAHLGNWELGAMTISLKGYKLNVVAHKHSNQFVEKLFEERRRMYDVNVFQGTKTAINCRNALRDNQIVGIMVDRLYGSRPIEVSLFGERATIPEGPISLSLMSKAPILPCNMFYDDKRDRYRLIIKKPIIKDMSNNISKEVYSQSLANSIEEMVLDSNGFWYIFENKWNKS